MFTQAQIEVENQQVFAELKGLMERALGPGVERFLQLVKGAGLRIRDFEQLLDRKIFEQLSGAPQGVAHKFSELSLSDQALIREFYLTQIEQVPVELRTKYAKLYRYA